MQNPQYLTENAVHSLSLGHSDAKEKAALLSVHSVYKGASMGSGLTLGCPTCTEIMRPI